MEPLDRRKTSIRSPSEIDPIDWAIVGVVVSGASLALSIKQKIEARQAAEAAEVRKAAVAGNRLRLNKMKKHMLEMRDAISRIQEIGKIVIDEKKTGLIRSSIQFSSEEEAEHFNRVFDNTTYIIARMNRLVSEIDLKGLPLEESDEHEYVDIPIHGIEEKTRLALNPDANPTERLSHVRELLDRYSEFLGNLEQILGARGD